MEDSERLREYPFYEAALGELELRAGRGPEAAAHFQAALRVARSAAERRFLAKRVVAARGGVRT